MLGGGWDQSLLQVPLWAGGADPSAGLWDIQSRGRRDSMLTHPLQAWGGGPDAEGMEAGCHPGTHSHAGNKPGGRVHEIDSLTESGVLLAGGLLGGASLLSRADPGLLSQATEGNESGRLSTASSNRTQRDAARDSLR